ncbi:MAG: hypothetical protein U0935_07185 [Pirellulales bacterium]
MDAGLIEGRFPTIVWVGAIALAAACTTGSLLPLAFPRWRTPWLTRCLRVAMLCLLALIGTEVLGDAWHSIGEAWEPWIRLLAVAGMVVAALSLRGVASWSERTTVGHERWRSLVLLVAAIALGLAAHWRLTKPLHDQIAADQKFLESLDHVIPATVLSVGRYALTDAGHRIELERFVVDESGPAHEERLPDVFRTRVIVEEQPGQTESPANCHGWVFTEGRYLVRGRYVDTILKDNGYHVVADPHPGDLIVYRDDHGEPIHTGIVKAVGEQGFVLIESKWGTLDTYLHLPEDQAYSKGYAYYRSPRSGHALRGTESADRWAPADTTGG